MDVEKQKLLLEYCISSPNIFGRCNTIMLPDYFDRELTNSVVFIKDYYNNYFTTPDPEQIRAETGLSLRKFEIEKDKIEYCTNEIGKFCKHKAMFAAAIKISHLLKTEEYGEMEKIFKDALSVSIDRDLGINLFGDDLLERMEENKNTVIYSTGYRQLDKHLFGGFERTTLNLFLAISGGGKSVVMANIGLNYAKQGLNVLYISLELYQKMVDARFHQIISGFSRLKLKSHTREAYQQMIKFKEDNKEKLGTMHIKYMPSGSNAQHIRGYLKEFHLQYGYIPDVIILDYLDLLSPMEKVSKDNVFQKDKYSSEEFRNILVEYNMIGISASQLNRNAIEASDFNQSHTAGGISKMNTVDNAIAIKLTERMKDAGEISMKLLKSRSSNGEGKWAHMAWNNISLEVSNLPEDIELKLTKKSEKEAEQLDKELMDLVDSDPTNNTTDEFFEIFDD